MKHLERTALVFAALCAIAPAALADITIGVSLPLTGPASALGITTANQIKLWPKTIAGEKLNLTVLDDATDPTKGVTNANRFVGEKVDIILGSAATPVAVPMAGVALESQTPQFMFSPGVLPTGKEAWSFRLAPSSGLMAYAMVSHMKKLGVKTVGFLGYADAYGESWVRGFNEQSAALDGPKIVAMERFDRGDSSVTAQALKLVAANPDAILIVASGSGAAMPHKAVVERDYKGKIYQTHAAAGADLVRVGGKDVNGAYVVSGPAVVAEQLPASHPSKAIAQKFVDQYDAAYGKGSRNQGSAQAYDAWLLLEKIIPVALKKAQPGTAKFRDAIREATENVGRTVVSNGVLNYTKDDHWGYTNETGVVLKIVNGEWKAE